MATIKIPQEATVTGLAKQYGTTVQNLLALNKNITNPNLIYAGQLLNIPDPAPAVVTSKPAIQQTNQNMGTLNNLEGGYAYMPYQPQQQPQVQTTQPSQQYQQPQPINAPISVKSANTALQGIINKTNQLITSSGIQLSPENKAALDKINGVDTQLQAVTASARDAANTNNYSALNEYIKQSQKLQEERDAQIKALSDQLTPLRQQYINSLAPSALETDLGNQLNDLKTKIANFDVSTQEGQQAEFGLGRPLALSVGRSEKLGQQANLQRQSYVNEANNLLGRLGLAQEARQAQSKGLEAGLGFLRDDIELQNKAYDRINQQEKDVFTRFQALDQIQRQQAADVLDSLQGVNPATLSPQARQQIAQIAESRGIPSDAIFSGLQTQYDKLQLDMLSGKADLAYKQAQIGKLRSETTGIGGISNGGILTSPITGQQIAPQDAPSQYNNRQQILSILSSNKIGAGTRTKMSDALNVMNAVEDFANIRQTEGFKGISPLNTILDLTIPFTDIGLIPFRESLRSNAGRENAGYIDAINLKVQQWASGASLTQQQTAQVNRFTPTTSDTDEAIRTKLNNLYNFMLTQVQGNAQSEGLNFKPERTDLFEIYNLIQKATPEQLQQLKSQGLIK